MTIDELLRTSSQRKASDLHLTVGLPPQLRIDGALTPLSMEPLSEDQIRALAYQMLDPKRIALFEEKMELDTSYSIKGFSRFRVNLFRQRGSTAAAIRVIPFEIPTLEQLGLPKTLEEFSARPNGLFIVSGPTGSGKSTTLAAMISRINESRNCHIICIEDPIEYLHRHKKATINQREMGVDTTSFQEALRHAVRQDPNVIMVGEMRDLETMSAVLTLAETGHLVLATLHTSDVVHAVHRIIDVFPPYQQMQIRVQLSLVLIGVVVQQLIPKASGQGRVAACEVMAVPPAVGNLIRENQLHQLRSTLQTGRKYGMCTMNQALADLYSKGLVSWEEIARRSTDLEELAHLVGTAPKR
ncbi:MAG: type IV pilus twitching motility protein PilT [Candidatus Omnitrophica bacterium]|nr:type IV pilus twitching motility protein PilT [Candidatus Omnitrophota bacterium]